MSGIGAIRRVGTCLGTILLLAAHAAAQVDTGSITGTVTDGSGGVLPGVTVSLTGDKLIGGAQSQTTDVNGSYRFDRLPPGTYALVFELTGFRKLAHTDIRLSASFVATVGAKLEVGELNETLTVAGEAPVVDTRSNVQQTVMNQEILEGVPTGRDPWAVAKIIPGVQVSTYDVGGTQGMQASQLSSHGSRTADVTYSIDGNSVNWPGGGGGAPMLYYDQGMFEEVSYQTSAIPAEVSTGGIYMNMVTKSAGDAWRGRAMAAWANDSTQGDNSDAPELQQFGFTGGNPIAHIYDVNVSGGGALLPAKLWVNGSYRIWSVDKLTLGSLNPDGTPALDDNRISNYSTKVSWQIGPSQNLAVTANYDEKYRYHRRATSTLFAPDRAAWNFDNLSSSSQVKYSLARQRAVLDSSVSLMIGETRYNYQDETRLTDIRTEDTTRSAADVAAPNRNIQPSYRLQFNNSVSYQTARWGGEHLFKVGVQFSRMSMEDKFWVNGDRYDIYNDRVPTALRVFNTPTGNHSLEQQLGLYVQDSWTVRRRLTLNLGARFDRNTGWMPAQTNGAGTYVGERSIERRDVLRQGIGVWRLGAVYDVFGNGATALKASASRYGAQVGIDRVQTVHPFTYTNGTLTWNDVNGDRVPQDGELGPFSGFADANNRYAGADGPDWPYSDEITAGVEHQLLKDLRVGATYFYRTNRNQVGFRNAAVPLSAYTPVTIDVPGGRAGPGGTVTFYNLSPDFFGGAFLDNVYDNEPVLDTTYHGVDITAMKRLSGRWQMLAGLTLGRNEGGTATGDLNDPNNFDNFAQGIVGNDSAYAFRLSGSYDLPWAVTVSGSFVLNQGYPYQSTMVINRAAYAALTRPNQTVRLSRRGDERLEDVAMLDLRVSRTFRFLGNRTFTPQVELFNLTNTATVLQLTTNAGSLYRAPGEIVAPRLMRVGFSMAF